MDTRRWNWVVGCLAAASLALLGCGDDRGTDPGEDEGLADAGVDGGGTMDAQGCPEPDELWEGISLEEFTPLPDFETLMVEDIMLPEAATYWELRRGSPGAAMHEVLLTAGDKCAEAEAPDVCRQEFDDLVSDSGFGPSCLPGQCYQYIVVNRGDTNQIVATQDELVTFLGDIDTPTEAASVAYAGGYGWDPAEPSAGSVRAIEGGYELLVTELTQDCDPIVTDRVQLTVSTDGEVTVVRRQIYSVNCGACI